MAEFAARLRARCRQFRRNEDGSLIVFGLFLFSIIVLLSGMAVDIMRVENRRVALSQALDRCTLNAASLRQTIDAETVVRDCVQREGMLPFLTSVSVSTVGTTRSVEARGSIPVETLFMDAMGFESLTVAARSRAEQSGNLEIVLVLDVSGSMRNQGRITGLRTAAANFVDTVLANNPDRASIAVVPYAGKVKLGPDLAAKYNITSRSGLGVTQNGDMRLISCVDLPPTSFSMTGIPRSMPLPSTGWFDGFRGEGSTNVTLDYEIMRPLAGNEMCRPSVTNIVRMPDNNRLALTTYLNGLVAEGSTAINDGMKWGAALLDPQARSVVNEFVDSGTVPAIFRDRPADYNRPGTSKIIVLMTDGQNETDARLNEPYKTGPSPIFMDANGNLSIQHTSGRPASAGSNQFWDPFFDPDQIRFNGTLGQWRATPAGASATVPARRLNWDEVWQVTTPAWVAWQLYARALATTTAERDVIAARWRENFRTRRGNGQAAPLQDAELQQICDAVKQQGVLIYAIAFSAPERGINATRNCASSESNFFVSNNNASLNVAFQAIATNLTNLRLTN